MDPLYTVVEHLTKLYINEHPNCSEKQCIEWLYRMSPDLMNDPLYSDIIKNMLKVVYCEIIGRDRSR